MGFPNPHLNRWLILIRKSLEIHTLPRLAHVSSGNLITFYQVPMINSYVSNVLIQSQVNTYASCDIERNKVRGRAEELTITRWLTLIPIIIYIYIYINKT